MSGMYDVNLAASSSAAQQVGALGSYVKIVSAPGGAVIVRLDGGEAYRLLEGQGVRSADGQHFRDVQVNNASGVAQLVLLFVGDSRFEDTRITGTVSVVDTNKSRTLAGLAYTCSQTVAAVAAQKARGGVFVPPGALRRTIIERIRASTSGAAEAFSVGSIVAALANADASLRPKLIGSAPGNVAQRTWDTNAAAGITTYSYTDSGVTRIDIDLKTPIVVVPGTGFIVVGETLNQDLSFTFDLFEEAV